MEIVKLIQADGFFSKLVGSTRGGEYAGPCPWCGGKDRFRCWPNQGESGKYWCRQCGRSGDAIQYLRDYRSMSYQEACQYVGREPRVSPLPGGRFPNKPDWEPRTCSSPGDLWQGKAGQLVGEAVYHLWSPSGKAVVRFLIEGKGLAKDTIKRFSLGWIPRDRWDAAPAWGLTEVTKDNGKPKKLWFPKGVTIPLFRGEHLERVRIRRPEGEPRYYLLRGSSSRAMLIGDREPVTVMVESELDAILLYQEAGDLVNLLALGNAQTRPDQGAADFLNKSRLILNSLDADRAGAVEAWRWWKNHYPQAHRWPPIHGKDPGDMFKAGMNLRAWIKAGLAEYSIFST